MITQPKAKLITAQEFWEFVNRPENRERFFELVEGSIVELSPANLLSSNIAARTIYFFMRYLEKNNIGYVTGADGGYIMSEHDIFAPDVGFILKRRQPRLSSHGFNPIPPDLAVEIVSPSDSLRDVREKATSYLALGTAIVSVVYSKQQTVEVYTLVGNGNLNVDTVHITGTLDGGDVMPGFTLSVADIFPA